MQTPTARREGVFALIVAAWIILLHLCVFFSAGALWRDESNSIQQSQLPTWREIWGSLQYDSFPVLYAAVLRVWCFFQGICSDRDLRLLGLVTGLAMLSSVWIVGRMVAGRAPLISLALFAANPTVISEGDSIRPYGLSILCLVWIFGCFHRFLEKSSLTPVALAVVASVLAVQVSYSNALLIGVLSICAILVAMQHRSRRSILLLLLPGFAAAISLLPYAGVLRQARDWASMLHSRIEWLPFLRGFIRTQSLVMPLLWAGFSIGAIAYLAWNSRREIDACPLRKCGVAFSLSSALASLAAQIIFIEASGVPPFPRYFLPSALFLALAFEAVFAWMKSEMRMAAVAAALLLTAAPAWLWARQRHTNVDQVAGALMMKEKPGDLIVISPWFLHPGFQRYYRGNVEWITVPELDRYPMTRYDMIKNEIMSPRSSEKLERRLQAVMARGCSIWFVSQRVWTNFDRRQAPERPIPPVRVRGADYTRYRSYWERDIEYRLRTCCRPVEEPLPVSGPVWDEEDLVLTRWSVK